MPDLGVQTHTVTLTHGLTHAAKRRGHKGLGMVCESVSLISLPKRMERRNKYAIILMCVFACTHVRTRVCARVCVKGWKQTHKTHRLTRRVARHVPARWHPFGPRRVLLPTLARWTIPAANAPWAKCGGIGQGVTGAGVAEGAMARIRYFPAQAGRRGRGERSPFSTDFLS